VSGIAAILHLDEQPIIEEHINQLVQAQVWRGPDHQGVWIKDSVALGAAQFWTTQEEWGTQQPLSTRDGGCIIMDGRLDNRAELGRMLEISRVDLETMSDAELLWATYKRWHKACVDHLAGAFAFVIWDSTNQTLFSARDPLGLRSFFYFWDERRFYAASTLQALRGLSFLKPTLDKEYIWDYLSSTFMGTFDPEATPLQEIRRLPAGHFLQLTPAGLEITRYWQPWLLPPIDYKQDTEYIEHFRTLFDQIVAAQCRTVGPLGAALSGGVDSSAVVCVAKELEREGIIPAQDLHAFSLLFNQSIREQAGELVNRPRLDMIAEKYGMPVHQIECDDWLPMFDEIPYRSPVLQDEPFILFPRPYRNMGYKIKKILPDLRVLLTGLGADEGLATTLFFVADWLQEGRFDEAWQAAEEVTKSIAPVASMSRDQVLLNLGLGGLGSRELAHHLRQKRTDITNPIDINLQFRFHFRVPCWAPHKDALTQRALNRLDLIPKTFDDISISTQAAFERNILLLGDNVRLWDDQYVGAAAGLEMRHPFYDRRLIEFFQRIPVTQKFSPWGHSKYVMRRSMVGVVPIPPQRNGDEEGEGFPYIYKKSLKAQWPEIEKMFADSRVAAAGFITPKLFLEELGKKRTGRGDVTDTEIISTLALEFWLRDMEDSGTPLV
jgi:asparagine synthase (glutamine-hydrolysing)